MSGASYGFGFIYTQPFAIAAKERVVHWKLPRVYSVELFGANDRSTTPMTSTSDIIKVLPAYVQALAVVTAGVWAYWKFIYQRQKDPASDVDLDLRFVGIQDQKWIIEVTALLENKSLVQHRYENFTVSSTIFTGKGHH